MNSFLKATSGFFFPEKIKSYASIRFFFYISSSGFESWLQKIVLLMQKITKSKEDSSLFRENKELVSDTLRLRVITRHPS